MRKRGSPSQEASASSVHWGFHDSRAHRIGKIGCIVVATHRLQGGPLRRWSQRLAGEHPARHRLADRVPPCCTALSTPWLARLDAKALHPTAMHKEVLSTSLWS